LHKLFSDLELQNINDVEYLRKTLSVEKSEEEALQYFQVFALLLVKLLIVIQVKKVIN
jgi:hypothetical protein